MGRGIFSRRANKDEIGSGEHKLRGSDKSSSPNDGDATTSLAILEKPEAKHPPPVGITELFR